MELPVMEGGKAMPLLDIIDYQVKGPALGMGYLFGSC